MTLKQTILVVMALIHLALRGAAQQNSFSIADIAKMNLDEKRQLFNTPMKRKLDDPSRLLDFYLIGIKDPDTITQRKAVQNLAWAVLSFQDMRRKGTPIRTEFSRLGELQQELGAKLVSPDAEMRGAAIHALVFSDAPNENLEALLLSQFEREPNVQLRASIINRMAVAGYDSDKFAEKILSWLLASDGEVRDAAAQAVAEIRPRGGLSKLSEALEQNPSQFVIEAIARYGKDALPYVPQLEKLAGDESVRNDLRDNERRAIEAIKHPKPEAKSEPKVKAVSLVDATQPQTPVPPVPPVSTPTPSRTIATAESGAKQPAPTAAESPAPVIERKSLVWPWLVGLAALIAVVVLFAKRRV